MQLPLIPVPIDGETVDGFVLKVLMSDGRYTRLFGAIDEVEGGEVALKFPKPQVAAVATYRAAFVREAWVGARVHSPWVGRTIELPPGRQTCLYTVMPLYQGELLSTRLARRPRWVWRRGAISRSSWRAAWRRCIAPASSIATSSRTISSSRAEGSLKLIDLGVVRVPGLEDFPPDDIPGTAAYMAPEMFAGEPGNEATDIYALGVTMFRAFAGEYPYGNLDATSPPRRNRPKPLSELRPDLPAWLQAALGRAIAIDPAERFRDVMEFAVEMEAGPARAPLGLRGPRTLYERSPVESGRASPRCLRSRSLPGVDCCGTEGSNRMRLSWEILCSGLPASSLLLIGFAGASARARRIIRRGRSASWCRMRRAALPTSPRASSAPN